MSLGFMKFSQLLMEMANRGIGRILGHLTALLGTLDMERAIIFRAHSIVPTLSG